VQRYLASGWQPTRTPRQNVSFSDRSIPTHESGLWLRYPKLYWFWTETISTSRLLLNLFNWEVWNADANYARPRKLLFAGFNDSSNCVFGACCCQISVNFHRLETRRVISEMIRGVRCASSCPLCRIKPPWFNDYAELTSTVFFAEVPLISRSLWCLSTHLCGRSALSINWYPESMDDLY